ncbi:hypothetical protein HDU83_009387 [Entophlyctis luteolus]|nr:hypothetical protein HDU83_009387 [Entophlyctis luteolus]
MEEYRWLVLGVVENFERCKKRFLISYPRVAEIFSIFEETEKLELTCKLVFYGFGSTLLLPALFARDFTSCILPRLETAGILNEVKFSSERVVEKDSSRKKVQRISHPWDGDSSDSGDELNAEEISDIDEETVQSIEIAGLAKLMADLTDDCKRELKSTEERVYCQLEEMFRDWYVGHRLVQLFPYCGAKCLNGNLAVKSRGVIKFYKEYSKYSDSKVETTFAVTSPSSLDNGMVTIAKLKTTEGRERVMATNKNFYENNRKLVQDFLDATQRGFEYAGAEKTEAAKMMVEVVNRQHRVDLALDALWDSCGGGGFVGLSMVS